MAHGLFDGKVSNFVEMLAANGSIFTILAISFERYYAICKPLKAGYKCTRLRATIIICLIWLLSSLLTSPILIMAKSSETIYIDGSLVYNCILETDTYWPKMYVFVSMFAFFCLPLFVLMVVYWLISRRLIRENLALSTTTTTTTTTTISPNQEATQQHNNTESSSRPLDQQQQHLNAAAAKGNYLNEQSWDGGSKRLLNKSPLATLFGRSQQNKQKVGTKRVSASSFALDGFAKSPNQNGANRTTTTLGRHQRLASKTLSLDHHFVILSAESSSDTNADKAAKVHSSEVNFCQDEPRSVILERVHACLMSSLNWIWRLIRILPQAKSSHASSSSPSSSSPSPAAECEQAPTSSNFLWSRELFCFEGKSKTLAHHHQHQQSLGEMIVARLQSICETRAKPDSEERALSQRMLKNKLSTSTNDEQAGNDERAGCQQPFLQSHSQSSLPSLSPPTLRVVSKRRNHRLDPEHRRPASKAEQLHKRRFFIETKRKREQSPPLPSLTPPTTTLRLGEVASARSSLKYNWGKRFSVSASSSTSTQTTNTTILHSEHSEPPPTNISEQSAHHNSRSITVTQSEPLTSNHQVLRLESAGEHNKKSANSANQESLCSSNNNYDNRPLHSVTTSETMSTENISSSACTTTSSSTRSTSSSKSNTPDSMTLLSSNEHHNNSRSREQRVESAVLNHRGEPSASSPCKVKKQSDFEALISLGKELKTPSPKSQSASLFATKLIVTNITTCDTLGANNDNLISNINSPDKNNNNINNNGSESNHKKKASEDRLKVTGGDPNELSIASNDLEEKQPTQEDRIRRIKLLGYSLDSHHPRPKSKISSGEMVAVNNQHHRFHFNLKRACKKSGKRIAAQNINQSHINSNKTHPSEVLVVKDLSKKQQMDSRRQVVIMLAFVVTCFFLLFFPYRVFTIWLILSTEAQVQSLGMETYYNLTYFSRILIYLHSAINPIAYNLISTKFRRAFMSMLLCRGSASRRHFTTEHRIINRLPYTKDQRKSSRQSTKLSNDLTTTHKTQFLNVKG